jgi:hypothetical protein
VPGDIWVHVVGINHMLNDPRSTFDPKNDFDMSLIVVLCSIIVRPPADENDHSLTSTNRAAKSSSTKPWKLSHSVHAGSPSTSTSRKASDLSKKTTRVWDLKA